MLKMKPSKSLASITIAVADTHTHTHTHTHKFLKTFQKNFKYQYSQCGFTVLGMDGHIKEIQIYILHEKLNIKKMINQQNYCMSSSVSNKQKKFSFYF